MKEKQFLLLSATIICNIQDWFSLSNVLKCNFHLSAITPCVKTMDRLPVENVIAPSPVTSSDKEIIELTPDMFEKYVDDVEMSDLPEGTTATVLEPSENFPETTVSL